MPTSSSVRRFFSPVVVVSAAVTVSLVVGILFYSAEHDLTFRVWGKEFGAVANSASRIPSVIEKANDLEIRIQDIEKRMSSYEAEISRLEGMQSAEVNYEPINKTRTLDSGQRWDIPEIGFSILLKSVVGFEGAAEFETVIKTSESPAYKTDVYEGWQRQFEANGREFKVTVMETNLENFTLKVTVSEIEA